MSITGILEKDKKSDSLVFGAVVGIVTNNKDEEGLGRVKVKIPRLSGEDESNWARVASFMAGKDRGAVFLPEVDDEVLVVFEHGDINMPYVIGALWNGKDTPPEDNSDGENNLRVIKSRSGHIIRLDDKDGEEKIEVIDKSGENLITIDTKENKITISSKGDIDLLATDGKLTVDAKEVEIKSSEAATVEAGGDLDLKSDSNVNVNGSTINLN